VVSKSQIRFKRTGARRRPIEKVVVLSIHWICEHLSEAVLHPYFKNQMRIPLSGATQPLDLLSPLNNLSLDAKSRFIKRGDGVLKSLLNKGAKS
jgi:hypothetical protein